jgi:catechol 2,3-dioxygenase-like lactoylglutathione lyase family enzyme
MESKSALVSTIKSVVVCVKNLDESRIIFEDGLGLKCVGETTTSASEIGEIWGVADGEFRVVRFAREGEDFGCIDLVENKRAEKPIRDSHKPFDYGIFTLNYRTNNIEKAVAKLESLGAISVSEILQYNVGKLMSEKMMILPTGERLTIIQIGDATDEEPFFNEAIATAGMVVPSMADAKRFYEDALGLTLSISFQVAGSPFDKLLGVAALDKLDFATFTANGNWTGKVELLELEVPDETPLNTNEFADFLHTGYTFLTFLTPDLDKITQNCQRLGAKIVLAPTAAERPFHKGKRAIIIRSLGGEYLEFIED